MTANVMIEVIERRRAAMRARVIAAVVLVAVRATSAAHAGDMTQGSGIDAGFRMTGDAIDLAVDIAVTSSAGEQPEIRPAPAEPTAPDDTWARVGLGGAVEFGDAIRPRIRLRLELHGARLDGLPAGLDRALSPPRLALSAHTSAAIGATFRLGRGVSLDVDAQVHHASPLHGDGIACGRVANVAAQLAIVW